MTVGSRRVLLVEDNKVNQLVARSLLEKRGHQVRVADNGRDAVTAVQEEVFDLILMDVQMPVLDGIEATRAIRALPEGSAVPIVALTAHAVGDERRRCEEAGMEGFLTKPIDPGLLFAAVEQVGSAAIAASGEHGEPLRPVRIDKFRELMREAGVEEIVPETLRIYLREAPDRIQRIRAYMAGTDARALEAETHALKSASLNIWAVDLAEYLDQAENAAAANDVAGAAACLASIEAELERVVGYLEGELGAGS
jgi:CheY-like chemotaxis protein